MTGAGLRDEATFGRGAMARFKLELEPDPDVSIIGISCHEQHYRLCWALNRSTGMNLSRRREDISENIDGRRSRYATFDHMDPDTNARCTLVRNHGGDGYLLHEFKQADYFLVIDNVLAEREPPLLDLVRSTEFVLAAFPLELSHLRAGHKLLQ